jgi:hypothetical protein
MRRTIFVVLALALLTVAVGAQTAASYQSVTVAASAVGVTCSAADVRMFATLETAQVRYRIDGSDPTSSEGHVLNAGDSLVLTGYGNIAAFRAIRTGSTSGVLKVTLFQ